MNSEFGPMILEVSHMDKIIDLYKIIIEQESSNHTMFLGVLMAMVAALLTATWWWNKVGASKEIKSEVEKKFKEEKTDMLNELNKSLQESTEKRFKKYEDRVLFLEGEVARSMAISAAQHKVYDLAVYWWVAYLDPNLKLKNDIEIRRGVDQILRDIALLEKQEKKEKSELKDGEKFEKHIIHNYEYVMSTVNRIPKTLDEERKKIKKALKGREKDEDDE